MDNNAPIVEIIGVSCRHLLIHLEGLLEIDDLPFGIHLMSMYS